jgi:hypothetical protein
MSNDTDYKIKIRGKTSAIDEALNYLDSKFQSWQDYQNKGITCPEAMKLTGATKPAEVVSWGFTVEKKTTKPKAETEVILTSWANENHFGNIWISGGEGELSCLLKKFPNLKISATFIDSYGRGRCVESSFDKEYARANESEAGNSSMKIMKKRELSGRQKKSNYRSFILEFTKWANEVGGLDKVLAWPETRLIRFLEDTAQIAHFRESIECKLENSNSSSE